MKPPAFTDEELLATLLAGVPWSKSRDIPDVVGWADLRHAPNEALASLRSRLADLPTPGSTQHFPIPKGGSGEYRSVAIGDFSDEIVYRALVGRLVEMIDASLGPEVASYRLATGPPGWRLRRYQYGDRARRSEMRRFIGSDGFGALGLMDVRHYLPRLFLRSCGGDPIDRR